MPQCTVLGPLLFLTYITHLHSTVSSQVHLFADVCLLYRPIKCRADQDQMQRDLSALQDWADRWGMRFNPSKCSVLRVSRPKKTPWNLSTPLKAKHYRTFHEHHILAFALARPWNGRPTLTKLQVKLIPLRAFFRGT